MARPGSIEEAAALLRELGAAGQTVRVRGGGTKSAWGAPAQPAAVELHTGRLDRVLEHNEGDFTAVLEAGVTLREAQAQFARAGQMLALDPPLGAEDAATIGGVVATADAGPLRHRYGGVRDLVLGVTIVLSDGTVARAGGRVIKNVAGYDLGKLFTGSFGTLGLIATVSVRLHPLTREAATARAIGSDPASIARAAVTLAALPLEADCLDVAWAGGRGGVLVRFSGATAAERAERTASRLGELGLEEPDVLSDDEWLWEGQRAHQRAPEGAVVKVAGVIAHLEEVLRAGDACGAVSVVSRAALGVSYVAFAGGEGLAERVEDFRRRLPDATLTVLDGHELVADPWPSAPAGALPVMERLKARFDPARVFVPGAFVEGL